MSMSKVCPQSIDAANVTSFFFSRFALSVLAPVSFFLTFLISRWSALTETFVGAFPVFLGVFAMTPLLLGPWPLPSRRVKPANLAEQVLKFGNRSERVHARVHAHPEDPRRPLLHGPGETRDRFLPTTQRSLDVAFAE